MPTQSLVDHAARRWSAEETNSRRLATRGNLLLGGIGALIALGLVDPDSANKLIDAALLSAVEAASSKDEAPASPPNPALARLALASAVLLILVLYAALANVLELQRPSKRRSVRMASRKLRVREQDVFPSQFDDEDGEDDDEVDLEEEDLEAYEDDEWLESTIQRVSEEDARVLVYASVTSASDDLYIRNRQRLQRLERAQAYLLVAAPLAILTLVLSACAT